MEQNILIIKFTIVKFKPIKFEELKDSLSFIGFLQTLLIPLLLKTLNCII